MTEVIPCVQGTISDMLEDVNTGIAWVLARCHAYGGDPMRVYLIGQSCGAQLGTLALITQVLSWPCTAKLLFLNSANARATLISQNLASKLHSSICILHTSPRTSFMRGQCSRSPFPRPPPALIRPTATLAILQCPLNPITALTLHGRQSRRPMGVLCQGVYHTGPPAPSRGWWEFRGSTTASTSHRTLTGAACSALCMNASCRWMVFLS